MKDFIHSCNKTKEVINFDTFIAGLKPVFYGSYGACIDYYYKNGNIFTDDNLDNLCFVHGSARELQDGKKCVVRDKVVRFTETQELDGKGHKKWNCTGIKKAVIHLRDGRVILKIGTTANGNSVIVMK